MTRELALEAAAAVARQLGRQPWYAGVRVAPDAAEGHHVELLVRQAVNLKTPRVRGVRVVVVVDAGKVREK